MVKCKSREVNWFFKRRQLLSPWMKAGPLPVTVLLLRAAASLEMNLPAAAFKLGNKWIQFISVKQRCTVFCGCFLKYSHSSTFIQGASHYQQILRQSFAATKPGKAPRRNCYRLWISRCDHLNPSFLKFVSSSAAQLTVKDSDSGNSCDAKQRHSRPFGINWEYI